MCVGRAGRVADQRFGLAPGPQACWGLGALQLQAGKGAEAQVATKRYLEIIRETQTNEIAEITGLSRLGKCLEMAGDFEAAGSCYYDQLDLARRLQKPDGELLALDGLARTSHRLQNHADFISYSNLLLEVIPESNPAKRAQVYFNIGSIQATNADYENAETSLRTAIDIYKQAGILQGAYKSFRPLISIMQVGGEARGLELAQCLHERAYIAGQLSLGEEECAMNFEAGQAYIQVKQHESALPLLRAGCEMAVSDKLEKMVSVGFPLLQQALYALEDFSALRDSILEHLEVEPGMAIGSKVKILGNLSLAHQKLGAWAEAAKSDEGGLALALDSGMSSEAAQFASSAAASFKEMGQMPKYEAMISKRNELLGEGGGDLSSHYDLALLFTKQRKHGKALDEWKKCYNIAESSADEGKMLEVANFLVGVSSELKEDSETYAWQKKRRELLQRKGDAAELAKTEISLGTILSASDSASDHQEAAKHLQRAKTQFLEQQDTLNALASLSSLASLYQKMNALDLMKSALKEKMDLKSSSSGDAEAETINALGNTYLRQKQLSEAVGAFKEAMAIATKSGDGRQQVLAQVGLARVASFKAKLPDAKKIVGEALFAAQQMEARDQKLLGDVYCEEGRINQLLGEFMAAVKSFQDARDHYLGAKDAAGEYAAVLSLGNIYMHLNELNLAQDYFRQVLSHAEKTKNTSRQCTAHLDLGNVMMKAKKYPDAGQHLQKALSLGEELGDIEQMTSISGSLSNLFFLQEDYEKALEQNKKALELAKEAGSKISQSRLMGNIGNLYAKLGRVDQAQEYHMKHMEWAKEIGDKAGYGAACSRVGTIMNSKIGDLLKGLEKGGPPPSEDAVDEALFYHEEYLKTCKQILDREGEGLALKSIAYTQYQKSKVASKKKGKGGAVKNPIALMGRNKLAIKQAEKASLDRMWWTAESGTVPDMRSLVKDQGMDADTSNSDQKTPLHIAAAAGKLDMVKYLVEEARVNVNPETHDYDTPYALALASGNQEVANYLKDVVGVIPFIKSKIVETLTAKRMAGPDGADFRTFSDYHRLAWQGRISQDMGDHQDIDPYQRTALMMACHRAQVDWVQARVKVSTKGLNSKDIEGWTPLHWCCAGNSVELPGGQKGLIEVASILIATDPGCTNAADLKGQTPYSVAIVSGNRELAMALRSKRARKESPLSNLFGMVFFFISMIIYGILFPIFVLSGFLRQRRIARVLGKIPQSISLVFRGDLGTPKSVAGSGALSKVTKVRGDSVKVVDVQSPGNVRYERILFLACVVIAGGAWAFPAVFTLFVVPLYDDPEQLRWIAFYGIGGFYLLMGGFLFWSVVKSIREKELKKVRHPQKAMRFGLEPADFSNSASRSVANVGRILFILYDFFVFVQFAIPSDLTTVADEGTFEYRGIGLYEGIGKRFLLEFKKKAFFYSFWAASGIFFLWFLLSSYMGTSMVVLQIPALRRKFPFVRPDFFSKIPGLSIIAPLLVVAAFLPVSTVFFKGLDCTYVREGKTSYEGLRGLRSGLLFLQERGANMTALQLPEEIPDDFNVAMHCDGLGLDVFSSLGEEWQGCGEDALFTSCPAAYPHSTYKISEVGCCVPSECANGLLNCMDSDREQQCWKGYHRWYAIIGLTYLVYFLPSNLVTGIYFLEPDGDTCDVRYIGAYMVLETAFKWILALLHTFTTKIPLVSLISCCIITGSLAAANFMWRPCQNLWLINHYRVVGYLINFWVAISTLFGAIQRIISDNKKAKSFDVAGSSIALWALVLAVGVAAFLAVGFFMHFKHSVKHAFKRNKGMAFAAPGSQSNFRPRQQTVKKNPLSANRGGSIALTERRSTALSTSGGGIWSMMFESEGDGRESSESVYVLNPLQQMQGDRQRASTVQQNPLAFLDDLIEGGEDEAAE